MINGLLESLDLHSVVVFSGLLSACCMTAASNYALFALYII